MMTGKRACAVQPPTGPPTEQSPFFGGRLSSVFDTKTTSFLVNVLPQFDGNPALQSLIMGFLFLTTGTAAILFKTMLSAPIRFLFLAGLSSTHSSHAGRSELI
jgi:hypothetical protein